MREGRQRRSLRDDHAPTGASPVVNGSGLHTGTSPVASAPRGLSPWSADRAPPIYTRDSVRPVHNLRYDWTGWLRADAVFPSTLTTVIEHCRSAWRSDGLVLDHWQGDGGRIQLLFTTGPEVSPVLCAGRAKGRLQHELRQAGTPVSFSRRIGLRTLGANTREIVERYVAGQAAKSDYVDPRFKAYLDGFAVKNAAVRLAAPSASGHGRYWYNLHVVITVQDRRFPMTRDETFAAVREAALAIADREGHDVAEVSPMPDHVHLVLRGSIEQSPLQIGLAYLNGLALALGNNRCWSEEFYVGTFSEYGVGEIAGAG